MLHSDELLLPELPAAAEDESYDAGLGDWGLAGEGAGSAAAREPLLLQSLLGCMEEHSPALHPLDSFAIRTLLLHRPVRIHKLSSLQPGRTFVQRVLVEGGTGEEAVLTLTLVQQKQQQQEDAAREQPGARPGGDAAGGGARGRGGRAASQAEASQGEGSSGGSGRSGSSDAGQIEQQREWRLASVRGEPRIATLPLPGLSPEFAPEAVVQSQLDALRRGDVPGAFELLAPRVRAALGGPKGLGARLGSSRLPYRELLRHGRAQTLRRAHSGRNVFLELVALEAADGGDVDGTGGGGGGGGGGTDGGRGGEEFLSPSSRVDGGGGGGSTGAAALWCWVLRLQRPQEDAAGEGEACDGGAGADGGVGDDENCWAIEAVVKVNMEAM
ncbi:hypothetical protein FOA52_002065 [Chlamydomonas sp. UWO 241]|nr:hypothetical protein FOA52_002065 [Chlamydomonas sp. UWO 241]